MDNFPGGQLVISMLLSHPLLFYLDNGDSLILHLFKKEKEKK